MQLVSMPRVSSRLMEGLGFYPEREVSVNLSSVLDSWVRT